MKIGFFITARLKSSRLKRKILLDLNGKTVLGRVIERCKAVKGVGGVVLCTSTNQQDNELEQFALNENIQFFKGSEEDVLQRLLDAARKYHYDAFLSITADNPLFSIYTSRLLLEKFKTNKYDFGFTRGLPIGMATSLLEVKALEVAVHMKSQTNTEIWGPFLNRSDFFNIYNLIVEKAPFDENMRLTIDYPEDYLLISNLYNKFSMNDIISDIDILNTLIDNPHLFDLNKHKLQRWPTKKELELINNSFNNAKEKGLIRAALISKKLQPNIHKETIVLS